jgi:hypothetical protein
MKGLRTPRVQTLTLALIVLLSACLKSTEPQPSLIQLNGSWHYTGVQTVPVPESLDGTMTILRESGTSFQGQIQLVGTNSQQQQRLLNGSVSGSESGTDVIDFDADLQQEATPRRHVGQIVADTITGTWVGSSSDGNMSSGTFRVERETK